MVTNMQSHNGKPVANQFVISRPEGLYFQSYETLIAFKPANGDTPTVTSAWNCSAITLKYLKLFLGVNMSKKQIADCIQAGSIILDDDLTVK